MCYTINAFNGLDPSLSILKVDHFIRSAHHAGEFSSVYYFSCWSSRSVVMDVVCPTSGLMPLSDQYNVWSCLLGVVLWKPSGRHLIRQGFVVSTRTERKSSSCGRGPSGAGVCSR